MLRPQERYYKSGSDFSPPPSRHYRDGGDFTRQKENELLLKIQKVTQNVGMGFKHKLKRPSSSSQVMSRGENSHRSEPGHTALGVKPSHAAVDHSRAENRSVRGAGGGASSTVRTYRVYGVVVKDEEAGAPRVEHKLPLSLAEGSLRRGVVGLADPDGRGGYTKRRTTHTESPTRSRRR